MTTPTSVSNCLVVVIATLLGCDASPQHEPAPHALAGASNSVTSAAPDVAYSEHFAATSIAGASAPGNGAGAGVDCSTRGITAVFAADASVQVTLVKLFEAGQPLALNETDALLATTVSNDLCLVKLNVGPGNPGPAGAPSTSNGIGIEVWLPAAADWKHRIHVLGSSGFGGAPEISSLTKLGMSTDFRVFGEMAQREGAVVSSSDGGHVSLSEGGSFLSAMFDASFGLTPDGKATTALWRDLSSRAIHETALKTKALAQAYYGSPARFSYYEGCSNGGRQGLKEAQDYPEDFDGIVAAAPALHIARASLSMLYAQIAMLRDLGRPLTFDQMALVSSAAVSACDSTVTGRHDGFVTDVADCRYDPTRDLSVLCAREGGINVTPACVTRREATVFNKIWYGPTVDGSVPSPETATGYATSLRPGQIHFGYTRGTVLFGIPIFSVAASFFGEPTPIPLATALAAVFLEDPAIAAPDWWIPRESARNGWKALEYADFAELESRGRQLSASWDDLDTGKTDLTQFRAKNGKIIHYHGTADTVLPIQGSNMYYEAVGQALGGHASVQDFYRYFQVPGLSHCMGNGSSEGRIGVSPPADPPLPQLAPDNEFYLKLIEWVEGDQAPERILARNSTGVIERPLCAYPRRARFAGGDTSDANRYVCE